jgi:hypothetical protein
MHHRSIIALKPIVALAGLVLPVIISACHSTNDSPGGSSGPTVRQISPEDTVMSLRMPPEAVMRLTPPKDTVTSLIQARAAFSGPLLPCRLSVTFQESNRRFEAHLGTSYDLSGTIIHFESALCSTGTRGMIDVLFKLLTPQGARVCSGQVSLPLTIDNKYEVILMNQAEDPSRAWWGITGSKSFPLPPADRRSESDSLWVMWGGNSISNPAIY